MSIKINKWKSTILKLFLGKLTCESVGVLLEKVAKYQYLSQFGSSLPFLLNPAYRDEKTTLLKSKFEWSKEKTTGFSFVMRVFIIYLFFYINLFFVWNFRPSLKEKLNFKHKI